MTSLENPFSPIPDNTKLSDKEKLARLQFLEKQLQDLNKEKDTVNKALVAELEAEEVLACEKSLFAFYQAAWPIFETGAFIANWHMHVITEAIEALEEGQISNLILQVPPGCAKLIDKDTPIRTSKGWSTHGSLVVGDTIYHPSGREITVTHVHPDSFADYRLSFSTGEVIYCNGDHLWKVNGVVTETSELLYINITKRLNQTIFITKIEKLKSYDYKLGNCITVSSTDGMYLVGKTSIPTHNSTISCVAYPAWTWLKDPTLRFITGSVTERLVLRDAVRTRNVINNIWYQKNWGSRFELTKGSNAKSKYENTANGYRLATSVSGDSIGERFDRLIIDDPHKPTEITSQVKKDAVWEWWSGTLSTRASARAKRILIHQRLAVDDLIGRVLESEEDWEVVNLPMEYETNVSYAWTDLNILPNKDPRTKEGELLFPQVKDRKSVDKLKKVLGTYGTAAQLQQRPVSLEGGLVKRKWFSYYSISNLVSFFTRSQMTIGAWDLSFGSTGGSHCVGEVWSLQEGYKKYLVDEYRGKWDWNQQKKAIWQMITDYPQIRTLLIEKKANGDGIIASLKSEMGALKIRPVNIIPVEVNKSKEVRLYMCLSDFEAGNVHVLNPNSTPWVDDYIEELITFPVGKSDDRVDVTTMVLNYLAQSHTIQKSVIITEKDLKNFQEKSLYNPSPEDRIIQTYSNNANIFSSNFIEAKSGFNY